MIIRGKKLKKVAIGWVAEFCPNCAEPRAMRLISRRMVSHIYWIPLHTLGTMGHELHCSCCQATSTANSPRFTDVVDKMLSDVPRLAELTNPMLTEAMSMAMSAPEMEYTLAEVDPSTETELVKALINVYARARNETLKQNSIDTPTMVAFIASFACTVVAAIAAAKDSGVMLYTAMVLFAVFSAATAILALTKTSRYTRRQLVPSTGDFIRDQHATVEDFKGAMNRLTRLDADVTKMLGSKAVESLEAACVDASQQALAA